MSNDSDNQLLKPHTTVTIRRCVPHATADGATALALETHDMGTIFVQMPSETIRAVRDALNQLDLIIAQGTGNA
jgi:hypothetical protein